VTKEELQKLAGITNEFKGQQPVNFENISHTAQALKDKEKKLGVKPGDSDWFKLWFSRPYMTGMPTGFRGRKKK
jgi:hypothetical protein